jgi:hypothetical protein
MNAPLGVCLATRCGCCQAGCTRQPTFRLEQPILATELHGAPICNNNTVGYLVIRPKARLERGRMHGAPAQQQTSNNATNRRPFVRQRARLGVVQLAARARHTGTPDSQAWRAHTARGRLRACWPAVPRNCQWQRMPFGRQLQGMHAEMLARSRLSWLEPGPSGAASAAAWAVAPMRLQAAGARIAPHTTQLAPSRPPATGQFPRYPRTAGRGHFGHCAGVWQ